jgi:hypothetical protein
VVALAALVVVVGTAVATLVVRAEAGGPHAAQGSDKPITLTLRATPLETQFSIDDGPPLENPYIGTFPRDHREHVIRAVAPGYPAKRETVVFGDDLSLRFALSMGARSGR